MDIFDGVYKGVNYYIREGYEKRLCGYIKVEEGHPWYGVEYDEVEVECHGGPTWSDFIDGRTGWWLGFDTNHHEDWDNPKDFSYVENECKKMIDQYIKVLNN